MSIKTRISNIRAETMGGGLIAVAFLFVGCLILWSTYLEMRMHAAIEAKDKAEILLHYNMAIHSYFTEQLRPSVWEISKSARSDDYFDPVWMSSAYAIREIEERFRALNDEGGVNYKEASVNARDPRNEADALEREFLEQVNQDPTIQSHTRTEVVDGQTFFITMFKGETLEESCAACHTDPARAPAGLIQKYGAARSFQREVGDVVSVISVRAPVAVEFNHMGGLLARQGVVLFLSLLGLFLTATWVQKRLLFQPIERLRQKAMQIISDDRALGQQIPLPAGRELRELTHAFNEMSVSLRLYGDRLERTIESRTSELHKSQYMLNSILGTIPHFVGVIDYQTGKFQYVNREFKRYLGETVEVILSKSIINYQNTLHQDDQGVFLEFVQKIGAAKDDEVVTAQFRVKRKSGEYNWLEFHALVFLRMADERPQQVLFTSQDITVQKDAEAKLTFLGLHDPLTGLSNRAQFNHFMDSLQSKEHYPVTVIMADIDNLKYVNDTHGHEAGDALLCSIADAIKASLRSSDIVARLGGDEFAALLLNTDENAAKNIQARIQKRLANIISDDDLSQAGLSMGMVTVTQRESIQEALRQADEIMYGEKTRKKLRRQSQNEAVSRP